MSLSCMSYSKMEEKAVVFEGRGIGALFIGFLTTRWKGLQGWKEWIDRTNKHRNERGDGSWKKDMNGNSASFKFNFFGVPHW